MWACTDVENIVKPAMSLVSLRAAPAFTANSRRDASSLTTHGGATGLAKPRKEVPLLSEEGNKGVLQYALYVWLLAPSQLPC